MDQVTLVEGAMAAGALSGMKDTASQAVKDAYGALKAKIKDRFSGNAKAELILAEHETAPQTWGSPLMVELASAGADRDADILAAAQALMKLVDPAGYQSGKYNVDNSTIRNSQLGDHNTQHNTEINVLRMSEQSRIDGSNFNIHIGQPGA